ncbi:MutS protein msh4 [Bonamia ostreae]|uniref:MutS protein msh4 n=1 Tax=Bonamia ostreae TaxID=126728 RepID=A0ABV2AIG7_9EUKA
MLVSNIIEKTSFALLALHRPNYKRPKFSEDGVVSIRQGRHPVIEVLSIEQFVPNDFFQSDNFNFHLITGPNASGKSTYLKQICVLAIMAHIGSFVPAENASFRIIDSILTRFPNVESLSENKSTFFKEMSEAANILNNANDNSLIVIDELGRATSSTDGTSVAWASAEKVSIANKSWPKNVATSCFRPIFSSCASWLPFIRTSEIKCSTSKSMKTDSNIRSKLWKTKIRQKSRRKRSGTASTSLKSLVFRAK